MMSRRLIGLLALLALSVILLAPDSAFAQGPRRGGAGSQRHRTQQTGQREPKQKKEVRPGSEQSTYSKFEPVNSEKDEELLGILTVKPLSGGTLKLNVRRAQSLTLMIAGRTFEMDPIPEFLTEGLFCTATWDWDKKPGEEAGPADEEKAPRPTAPKRLQSLSLDTLTVEGTIEEISGDIITIKAKPANGQQWPDIAARLARKPPKATDKPRRVTAKKLRIRIVDSVAAFKDAAEQELSLGDFEIEQKVQATIVYGGSSKKRSSLLVTLNSYTAEKKDDGSDVGPSEPRRPQGPSQPRGPRARRPGRR